VGASSASIVFKGEVMPSYLARISGTPRRRRAGRAASALAVLTVGALALSACSSSASNGTGDGPDNGAQLTMWVRHTDGEPVQKLVDLYNESHENQIKLTVIPGDAFQQKVGAAAGSKSLPDILGADVVYSPNYVDQGIFRDITDLADGLPFKEDLSQAHQAAASKDGKIYGLPLLVDSSLIVYNKTLYEEAGLDPEKPPTSFAEIDEHARAIRALGGDTYGFYFAGNAAGSMSYTMMPFAAAAGEPPLTDDGTTANIDSESFTAVGDLYRGLYEDDIVPSGAKSDDGTTWSASFVAGKIGILPIGTFVFGALEDVPFEWGVAPLPAPDGSAGSTFVGGDVVGVTSTSKNPEQAEDFLSWALTDEPQLEVWAKGGFLTPRFDLADNEYSAENPVVVQAIEGLKNGYTPSTLPYGEIFNSANGPWLAGWRAYIFDGDDDGLATAQDEIQKILDDQG
jgi:multiple sugar transport system substrate-binding protein